MTSPLVTGTDFITVATKDFDGNALALHHRYAPQAERDS
jgi:hypothetical protein